MPKIIVDMTSSLDGFIAGPDDMPAQPLGGRDGIRLHHWLLGGSELYPGSSFIRPAGRSNWDWFDAMYRSTGALLTGRRTYDVAQGWSGSHPIPGLPVAVLTHRPPAEVPQGRSSFTYCTSLQAAVDAARRAAGDKDVMVHGASTTQQLLAAGLADELRLHVAPLLLGAGRPLFAPDARDAALDWIETVATPEVVHVRYAVRR